jgi:hypothetical protein
MSRTVADRITVVRGLVAFARSRGYVIDQNHVEDVIDALKVLRCKVCDRLHPCTQIYCPCGAPLPVWRSYDD